MLPYCHTSQFQTNQNVSKQLTKLNSGFYKNSLKDLALHFKFLFQHFGHKLQILLLFWLMKVIRANLNFPSASISFYFWSLCDRWHLYKVFKMFAEGGDVNSAYVVSVTSSAGRNVWLLSDDVLRVLFVQLPGKTQLGFTGTSWIFCIQLIRRDMKKSEKEIGKCWSALASHVIEHDWIQSARLNWLRLMDVHLLSGRKGAQILIEKNH